MFKRSSFTATSIYPRKQATTVLWPSDTVLESDSGIWLVKSNKRLKYFSDRVFQSWNYAAAPIRVYANSIEHLKYGGVIGFRGGSLLENMADGKIYLVSDNKRRHIVNPDWFEEYGFAGQPIITVSTTELQLHDEGDPLD